MVSSLLITLVGRTLSAPATIAGNMEWEEEIIREKMPGYHPMIRFNPSSTFIFVSPTYITEGHYQQQDWHYEFHPETAIQLNHADVDKLAAELDPGAGREKQDNYKKSLAPFSADYTDSNGVLDVSYASDGHTFHYQLHTYGEGDDQLGSTVSQSESGLVGVWNAPEPFPERLDSKTRFRIEGVDGLVRFSQEAAASDAAQFDLLDLKANNTFRIHATVGTWSSNGSVVRLIVEGGEKDLTINKDGKLVDHGKVVYVRS